jgi:hypothetical protein
LWLEASLGKKWDLISISKLSMVVSACHTSYMGGSWSKAGPGKNARPYPKNNKRKRAEGMAQVVTHLPSEHLSTAKIKGRKFWHTEQHGWTLKTLCWVKSARHWQRLCHSVHIRCLEVKFIRTGGKMVGAGAGGGMGWTVMGRIQFGKVDSSGDGWWWRSQDTAGVLNSHALSSS